MMDARPLAARALSEVLAQGRSWEQVKAHLPESPAGKRAKYLSLNALRYAGSLQCILRTLLKQPLEGPRHEVHCLLLVALFELRHSEQPDYAVVHAAVEGCVSLKAGWAKGLVNAVLRRYLREQTQWQDFDGSQSTAQLEAQWEHPAWLIKRIQRAYPSTWQAILEASNRQAPMDCRVNLQQHTREAYLALLETAGMPATAIAHTQAGIRLKQACPVQALPGFAEGAVSVQDAAGIQAGEALDLPKTARLLDACCAPGNKSMALRERMPTLHIEGIERDALRAKRIHENTERLKLPELPVHIADAADTQAWWDNTPFDAVWLDAPCSSTGVIRRHPDIKWLRRDHDIEALHAQQHTLIQALWPCVKPGGLLLYSTCSILPDENQHVIARFLKRQPDAALRPLLLPGTEADDQGTQWLPCAAHDGFFMAGLYKKVQAH